MDSWQFKRNPDQGIIDSLLTKALFNNHLRSDIEKGEVFPAIRDKYIDFYCCGKRLFSFDGKEFKTHFKYASVYDYSHDYVKENGLKDMVRINSFSESYTLIKKNCKNYTSIEPYGVSRLYKFSPFVKKINKYVLLDVEICFKKYKEEKEEIGFQQPVEEKNKKSEMDRVDILLYNIEDKILHFIEAKHFSNGEIWSETKPEVIEQVQGYDEQLKRRAVDILKVYQGYIGLINKLFDLKLLPPIDLFPKTGLYIFGFDGDQKKRALELKEVIKNENIPVCIIGNPDGIRIEKLWEETCNL